MKNKIKRMNELVKQLNEWSRAYHTHNTEIVDNKVFDLNYDELLALEKKLG